MRALIFKTSWYLFFVIEILKIVYPLLVSPLLVVLLILQSLSFIMSGSINRIVLLLSFSFVFLLVLSLSNGYSIEAAVEECIRFFIIILILLNYKNYQRYSMVFFKPIILIAVISNFIFLNSVLFQNTVTEFFPAKIKDGGSIVNGGLFSLTSAFLNMCCLIILKDTKGFVKLLSYLYFAINTFSSVSFKIIPYLAMTMFSYGRIYFVIATTCLIGLIIYLSEFIFKYWFILLEKINFYILIGNSARFEGYRVLKEEFENVIFIGYGLGSFGGPSSIKYDSPYYEAFRFNWFYTTNMNTIDTFYPHLFIELGLFGGIVYLSLIIYIFLKSCKVYLWSFFILAFLIFDSFFSFGLKNSLYIQIALTTTCYLQHKNRSHQK